MNISDPFDIASLRNAASNLALGQVCPQQAAEGSEKRQVPPTSMRRKGRAAPSLSGIWIPADLAISLVRLNLTPPSRWQVFLLILIVWCRYGRKEAFLTIEQIAARVDLSERTAQAAVSDLIAWGLVSRVGRCGKLVVVPDAITRGLKSPRHVRRHRGAGPHSLREFDRRALKNARHGSTDPRQQQIVSRVGDTQPELSSAATALDDPLAPPTVICRELQPCN
jgi:hypothetical protein